MTPPVRVGVALTVLLHVSILTTRSQDQPPAPLAAARLDHIAIATQDANRTAAELADIVGAPTTAAQLLTSEAPDGSPVRLRTATVKTAGFSIDVTEPVSGASPTREFLDRFGPGIELIGFSVSDSLAGRVTDMEQRGGVVTLRQSTPESALVVFPQHRTLDRARASRRTSRWHDTDMVIDRIGRKEGVAHRFRLSQRPASFGDHGRTLRCPDTIADDVRVDRLPAR